MMLFKSSNHPPKGSTLIEVLVFTSIAATMMMAVGGVFVSGLNTRAIIEAQQQISSIDRFIAFSLESEIMNADSISFPLSGSSETLIIHDAVNARMITFSKVGDRLQIQRGIDPSEFLNELDVRIQSFNVTRLTGTPGAVKVDIVYEMNTSSVRTLEHPTSFTFVLRYE